MKSLLRETAIYYSDAVSMNKQQTLKTKKVLQNNILISNKLKVFFKVTKKVFNTNLFTIIKNPVNTIQEFKNSRARILKQALTKESLGQIFINGLKFLSKPRKYCCDLNGKLEELVVDSTKIRLYCEISNLTEDSLFIRGWCVSMAEIRYIRVLKKGKVLGCAEYGLSRDDVGKVYPHFLNSDKSGFEFRLKYIPSQEEKLEKETFTLEAINYDGNIAIEKSEFRMLKPVSINLDKFLSKEVFVSSTRRENSKMDMPIDIIIPVYNGYDFLEKLFESVFQNTFIPYRIIIINDASLDERVWPYLQEIAANHSNIELINNEINLGFIKSVNKAVAHSENHFVLLNTDVEVPPHWLTRLMNPILSDDQVASTTPFTNAGTICSFPNFLEDNPIFENLDVTTLDYYFQHVNPKRCNVKIPTGVGFCMGINRTLVHQIGMFDELFGKGYGEENDWCQRASKLGYQNLMVSNLFVYHKHGGSFVKTEKKQLMELNLNFLSKRYPDYNAKVQAFKEYDPLFFLRNFLAFKVKSFKQETKVTLVIDHALGGGANSYREQFIDTKLKQKEELVLLLTFDRDLGEYDLQFYSDNINFVSRFKNLDTLEDLFEHISIDDVVINELVTYPETDRLFDMFAHLKANDNLSKLVFLVHDYYSVCPCYVLVNNLGEFCNVPTDLETCEGCLKEVDHLKLESTDIYNWRKKWQKFLKLTDEIVCFSNSTYDIMEKAYPSIIKKKAVIVPHQIKDVSRINYTKHKRKFVVGVLGLINYHKGAKILTDLADMMNAYPQYAIELVVIGDTSNRRTLLKKKHVTITGKYQRKNLESLIKKHKIDTFILPSICPETFSYTTEEVIKMELPIVVFNFGAPPERVVKYAKGHILEEVSAISLFDKLKNMSAQKKRLTYSFVEEKIGNKSLRIY